MENKDPYRYERLSGENLQHLVTLYNQVFHKKVAKEFLQAKYGNHYLGLSYLGYLAFDMHTPVAFAGLIPYRIQYKDQMVLGVQNQDGISTEQVRGKGVYTKLNWMAEEAAIKEGAQLAFGFGNQNSAPALINKLGYHSNETLSVFEIPVGGFPMMKWYNKFGWKRSYQNKLEKTLRPYLTKETFDNPWSTGLLYDFNFFQYKSYQPHCFILVEGVKVWIKASHVLSVGNIENCGEEKLLMVIEKLKSIAKQLGFDQLLLQFSAHSLQAKVLGKKYSSIKGTPIVLKNFSSNIRLDELVFAQGDMDTF